MTSRQVLSDSDTGVARFAVRPVQEEDERSRPSDVSTPLGPRPRTSCTGFIGHEKEPMITVDESVSYMNEH